MDKKEKAAGLSVFSNSSLVILKFVVGVMIGSVSVISDAVHSLSDLLASVIAYFSIRAASKPADSEHQFGHGKIENVSGTIEALLIVLAAFWVVYEAVRKLMGPLEEMKVLWPGLLVMVVAIIANFLISRYLLGVARETDSIALEADALHLSTDVYTSVAVFVGLIVIQITGLVWLDAVVAMVVALIILKASWMLLCEAFLPLIDSGLPPEEEQIIREVIAEHCQYFRDYHALRTRKAGSDRHIDLHLVVPSNAQVDVIHQFCHHVEEEVERRLPHVQVLIHVEPCDENCQHCSHSSNSENGNQEQVFDQKCRIRKYHA